MQCSISGRTNSDTRFDLTLNVDGERTKSSVSCRIRCRDRDPVQSWRERRSWHRLAGQGHWSSAVVTGYRVSPGQGHSCAEGTRVLLQVRRTTISECGYRGVWKEMHTMLFTGCYKCALLLQREPDRLVGGESRVELLSVTQQTRCLDMVRTCLIRFII